MIKSKTSKVIAFGSAKGGSGKTTICSCLAVEAAKTSRVVIVDGDPQQSIARWHELRRKHDDTGNPGLFRSGTEPLSEKTTLLKDAGAEWVMIDLPPGDLDLIEEGIAAADFVVIPIRASPLDVEAIGPVKDLCEAHSTPYGVLINAFEPTWKISATVGAYCKAAKLPLLESSVSQRQAYTGAMVSGETGPEYHEAKQARVCGGEIADLWQEVRKRTLAASGRG